MLCYVMVYHAMLCMLNYSGTSTVARTSSMTLSTVMPLIYFRIASSELPQCSESSSSGAVMTILCAYTFAVASLTSEGVMNDWSWRGASVLARICQNLGFG